MWPRMFYVKSKTVGIGKKEINAALSPSMSSVKSAMKPVIRRKRIAKRLSRYRKEEVGRGQPLLYGFGFVITIFGKDKT
jgi:hypothetical protein